MYASILRTDLSVTKGQAHRLSLEPHGVRVLFRMPENRSPVVGVFGNAQVMDADADALGSHCIHETVAADSSRVSSISKV